MSGEGGVALGVGFVEGVDAGVVGLVDVVHEIHGEDRRLGVNHVASKNEFKTSVMFGKFGPLISTIKRCKVPFLRNINYN